MADYTFVVQNKPHFQHLLIVHYLEIKIKFMDELNSRTKLKFNKEEENERNPFYDCEWSKDVKEKTTNLISMYRKARLRENLNKMWKTEDTKEEETERYG